MRKEKCKKPMMVLLVLSLAVSLLAGPSFSAQAEEGGTEVSCKQLEDCAAAVHVEGCPKYTAPVSKADPQEEAVEKLVALIAELPAPSDINPEDEEALQRGNEQIKKIYEFAEENGLELTEEQQSVVDAVTAAMYPVNQTADVNGIFTAGGIRYRIIDDSHVKVISNTDDAPFLGDLAIGTGPATYRGEIAVPATVEDGGKTYTVTEIGMMAFNYASSLTKVTLPDTIEVIGNGAFHTCSGLKEVVLNNQITKIGDHAFYNCTALTRLNLPEGLLTIGGYAFEGCTSLAEMTIPSTVTAIGSSAFGDCKSLTSLQIPAGVTEGLVKALVGNQPYPHLAQVTVADGSPYEIEGGVLYKGTAAHLYMGSEEHVTVREGTTEFADDEFNKYSGIVGVFAQNTKLKSIVLPDTITEIPERTFHSAVAMESITLPSTLTTIGDYAFYNTGLLKVTLPESVETIGNSAFQGCIHMESVDFPSELESMGTGAFADNYCLKKVVVPKGLQEIPDEAFAGCIALESVVLPEGITRIGAWAFYLKMYDRKHDPKWYNPNPQLDMINIPSTVTSLGENFLGGLKENGGTALVFQGETPPTFETGALDEISGNYNSPTIYYPAPARGAYAGADSPLKDLLPVSEEQNGKQGYAVQLSDMAVCPGKTAGLQIGGVPEGIELKIESSDESVVTVEVNDGNVTVTGVEDGSATVTATLILNGLTLDSGTCTFTKQKKSEKNNVPI